VEANNGVNVDIAFLRTCMRQWTRAVFLSGMWYLLLFLYERMVTWVSFDLVRLAWLVSLRIIARLKDGNALVA